MQRTRLLYLVHWVERDVFKVGVEAADGGARTGKWVKSGATLRATWVLPDDADSEMCAAMRSVESAVLAVLRGRGLSNPERGHWLEVVGGRPDAPDKPDGVTETFLGDPDGGQVVDLVSDLCGEAGLPVTVTHYP